MAKKTANVIDESFDFDSELDDFDFDLPDPTVKDDRKPVIKITQGVKEGVKDVLTDPAFAARSIKKIFPPGYGEAFDEADRIGQTVKSLYDDAAREMKPAIRQTKQVLARFVPPDWKLLPKSINKALDDVRNGLDEDTQQRSSADDTREALLSSSMAELFAAEAETRQKQYIEDKSERELDKGVEITQSKNLLEAMSVTAGATSSLNQYNLKIGVNVQKKQLELQYRQLFAQQDMLAWMREDAQRRDEILLAISKNSALPEFVKIRDSEARKQAIKNKFYDAVATGLYGARNDYLIKTLGNVKKRVGDSVRGGVQGFMSGLSEITSIADMADGMVDPHVLAGNIAGSGVADGAGHWLAKKLGKKLVGSSLDQRLGISDKAHRLSGMVDSIPNYLNEFRQDGRYSWGTSLKDRALSFVQGLLPSMSPNDKADVQRGANMLEPYHFTRRTDRSINEIIPGYLARIYRELQITRTGDVKIPLTEYDHENNAFARVDTVAKSIMRDVAPAQAVAWTQQKLEDLLTHVNAKTLTPEAQSELKKKFLFNSADNRVANRTNLASEEAYENVAPAVVKEIVDHMNDFFNHASKERVRNFEVAHNRAAASVADPRAMLQTQLDLGRAQHLKSLNLLNMKTGQFNLPKILSMYLDPARGAVPPKPEGYGPLTTPPGGKPPGEMVGPQPNFKWYLKNGWYKRGEILEEAKKAYEEAKDEAATHVTHVKTQVKDLYEHRDEHVAQAKKSLKVKADELKTQAQELMQQGETLIDETKTKAKSAVKQTKRAAKKAVVKTERAKRSLKAAAVQAAPDIQTQVEQIDQKVEKTLGDLYVASDGKNPRIRKAILKAQGYRQKTTKRIVQGIQDLTDDIIDEEGNEVLSKDEIPTLVTIDPKTRMMKRVSEISGTFNSTVSRLMQDERVQPLAKQVQAKVSEITANVQDKVQSLFSSQEISDLYVEGETEPRITKVEMETGQVVNVDTKSPVTKPEDITGDVKNAKGEIVLRRFELPRLRIWNYRIGKYTPLWFAGKLIKGLYHFQTQVAPGMAWRNLKRVWSLYSWGGKAVLGTAKFLLGIRPGRQAEDLYRAGEIEPVIIGRIMANGGYFSVRNGKPYKPVLKPEDISGELRDTNNQVVITDEDYKRGLFNIHGRKVTKSLLSKAISAVLRLPGRIVSTALKGTAKLASAAVTGAAKSAGWVAKKSLGGLWSGTKALGQGLGWLGGIRYEGNADERKELFEKRRAAASKPLLPPIRELSLVPKEGQASEVAPNPVAQSSAEPADFVSNDNSNTKNLTLAKLETKFKGAGRTMLSSVKKRLGIGRDEAERLEEVSDLDAIKETLEKDREDREKEKVRQGSYEDQQTHKKARADDGKPKSLAQAAKDEAKKTEQSKSGKSVMESVVDAAEGVKDALKGGKKGVGLAKNVLKSLFSKGKTLLGLGGAAAAETALGAEAAAGTAAAAEGTAALASTAAAVGAEGAAATAAGAGGAGLLALAAPVVLGVAALALAGYGAYRAVKYFRRGHLSPIGQLRMVQYGFAAGDTDHAKQAIDFEQLMTDAVKLTASGIPTIDESRIGMSKRMGAFGLNYKDGNHIKRFVTWYMNRFKPVFLTHMAAIKGLTGKLDLGEAEDLTPEEKHRFIEAAAFPNGPYSETTLPIVSNLPATTAADVTTAAQFAQASLGDKGLAARIATTAAGAVMGSANAKTLQTKPQTPTAPQPPKAPPAPSLAGAAAAAAAVSTTQANAVTKPSVPDAETKPPTSQGTPVLPDVSTTNVGTLTGAAGDLYEGRNANAYLKMARGVKLDGMNPQMQKQLMGLIEEFGTLTGRATTINDGVRSYEDQVAMKRKYGDRAAEPGTSLHEFGLAVDIDHRTLDDMDKLGLLRKYGFVRPVGQEPWHMEPIGTQDNLGLYKNNPEEASRAVMAGIGKGGGGYGTLSNGRRYGRDEKLSQAIEMASVDTQDPTTLLTTAKQASTNPLLAAYAKPQSFSTPAKQPTIAFASPTQPSLRTAAMTQQTIASNAANFQLTSMAAANDGEATANPVVDRTSQPILSQPQPDVQIPDPKGSGLEGLRDTITGAAKVVGIDANALLQTVAVESDFNPNASNPRSSAKGLAEFTDGTWAEMIKKYGHLYGYTLDNCSPMDAKASCLMLAHYFKDNLKTVARSTTKPLSATDGYMAHLLGPTGAGRFLSALGSYPTAVASQMFPQAAVANRPLFYDGPQPLTIQQVYDKIDGRIRDKSKQYGLATGAPLSDGGASKPIPATAPTTVMPGPAAQAAVSPPPQAPAILAPQPVQPPIRQFSPAAPVGLPTYAMLPPTRPQPQQQLDTRFMNKTEDLLSMQLEVQQDMSKSLKTIAEAVTSNNIKPSDKSSDKPETDTKSDGSPAFVYRMPQPAVSMKRNSYS